MFRMAQALLGAAATLTAREIESKIRASTLCPSEVKVVDTSAGCGSFFKITVASPQFVGKSMIQQHRMVNEVLKEEIKVIHGFTLETKAN